MLVECCFCKDTYKKDVQKIKRLGDWLSYNLRFKDLGFLIVSTMLIRVFTKESNLKPLNPYLEADQQNQTLIGFRSKIFPLASMGSFGMR